jgi:hypothetical protein
MDRIRQHWQKHPPDKKKTDVKGVKKMLFGGKFGELTFKHS